MTEFILIADRTQSRFLCSVKGQFFLILTSAFGLKVHNIAGFGLQSFGVSSKTVRLLALHKHYIYIQFQQFLEVLEHSSSILNPSQSASFLDQGLPCFIFFKTEPIRNTMKFISKMTELLGLDKITAR